MIATLFLQYASVANRLKHQPSAARYNPNTSQAYKTWLGIVAALAIHIAWLTLLPAQEAETPITLPQPIMVNWINTAAAEAPTPPAAKPMSQPEQKLKPAKPKPVAKIAKPKPVLATAGATTCDDCQRPSGASQQRAQCQPGRKLTGTCDAAQSARRLSE